MAFGEILRNARVQKGLTPSDVAESTHMLVQVVESLEQEDFRRIAAPIYGRGFVKLYAELLELDPEPLLGDFMNLYSGARAPAVLTKKVEPPEEPAPVPAPTPVTRTVTQTVSGGGGSPVLRVPPRQPVPPRPVVRSVAEPEPEPPAAVAETVEKEVAMLAGGGGLEGESPVESSVESSVELPAELPAEAKKDFRPALIVKPEEPYAMDPGEPDLFHPRPPLKEASGAVPAEAEVRKQKFPIFQVGGRLEKESAAESHDAAAHARRMVRVQAFVDGITKLKEGVGRRFPDALPRKMWLVGGAGLLLAVVMVGGISMLFKLTGSDVKTNPAAKVERIAPPPPLYVD
jgi:hypothetical protein